MPKQTKQTETKTAAQSYREHIKSKAKIIDVTAPSGFVFKFREPSKVGFLFPNELLSVLAEEPAKEQRKLSIDEAQAQLFVKLLHYRDQVLEYSHLPKIVIGRARSGDELSTENIPNEDLLFLLKWIAAGGDQQLMAAMFPQGV